MIVSLPLQGGSSKIMPSLEEGIIAKGATRQAAKSLEDVMHIFYSGAVYRATGETKMNRVSSCSHAVLTLFIKQKVQSSTFLFQNSGENVILMCGAPIVAPYFLVGFFKLSMDFFTESYTFDVTLPRRWRHAPEVSQSHF